MHKRTLLKIVPAVAGLAFSFATWAAPPVDLDEHVNAVIREQGVPGMAVTIVEQGKVVHAKGYGVRRLGSPEPVDATAESAPRISPSRGSGGGGAGPRRRRRGAPNKSSTETVATRTVRFPAASETAASRHG